MSTTTQRNILILAPHCDDAEFGLGASIQRWREEGASVHVLIASCSDYKGTVLKQYKKGRWGHLKVCLFRNGAQKRGPDRIDFPVHRLVAQAFVTNPDNLPEVRHRNGIAWDNRPSNLIWGTSAENREDMRRHGTGQGAHASQAKVDWPIVTYMRECSESDRNLAAKFEVSRELVRDIRAFKKWVPGTPEQQRINFLTAPVLTVEYIW